MVIMHTDTLIAFFAVLCPKRLFTVANGSIPSFSYNDIIIFIVVCCGIKINLSRTFHRFRYGKNVLRKFFCVYCILWCLSKFRTSIWFTDFNYFFQITLFIGGRFRLICS